MRGLVEMGVAMCNPMNRFKYTFTCVICYMKPHPQPLHTKYGTFIELLNHAHRDGLWLGIGAHFDPLQDTHARILRKW
jgi:hypothetical protein